ncbi:hypothetical protein [Maridesulfovibrio sp.]|uniref:hypothetical protein n=1 Tax=Maridesulfovibrio sp. TaxID=2795000 RepID=UPI002AA75A70|nr:hypothetical protein [Maridesulfovibrio sp.]
MDALLKDFEIDKKTAKAFGDAAGAITGIIAAGTPAAPLAPIISMIVTGGLILTNSGYEVEGLSALQKKAAAIEKLEDLTP